MVRLASFVALYFPVFLLGAVFGKLIEISGFARSITSSLVRMAGPGKSVFTVVAVCGLLTYGGVSLFVVAFSIYPFAAELFREARIPKRLIPATIALGAFTFTMDALPGSPQIQNIIPTTFFHTDAWAAPRLGLLGGAYVFLAGLAYLEYRRRRARRAGEGYGEGHLNEPAPPGGERLPLPAVAMMPLVLVVLLNKLLTSWIGRAYGHTFEFDSFSTTKVASVDVDAVRALWAVEGALLAAILLVVFLSFGRIRSSFKSAAGAAVSGALLAGLNTGSEYGFGAVIALLPGFQVVNEFLSHAIHNTLLNVAVRTNILAGITGSASGGMSIVLASMGETYLRQAQAAGIPAEVLHRVTAMASGGMDTLPHNGAVITLLAITGLTHRQAYKDIFAMTLIKVTAVAVVIGIYYLFGIS
jgi:H+/gluconate symporter-like permease